MTNKIKTSYIIGLNSIPTSLEELHKKLFYNVEQIDFLELGILYTREISDFTYKQIVKNGIFILTKQEFDEMIDHNWIDSVAFAYPYDKSREDDDFSEQEIEKYRKEEEQKLKNMAEKYWQKFKNSQCFKINFKFNQKDYLTWGNLFVQAIYSDIFRNVPNIYYFKDFENFWEEKNEN